MTPKPVIEACAACKRINLEVIQTLDRLIIYRAKAGPLLRSFDVIGYSINADDFNKWWQFMGFDNGKRS